MCTAISFCTKDHYFGRNLDLEYSYNETVTITPRNYPFSFRKLPTLHQHYAIIGMAYIQNDYPLYYDATNEKGLSIAGLNFPDNAYYHKAIAGLNNIAPFELIPWLLGKCTSVTEAVLSLFTRTLIKCSFSVTILFSPEGSFPFLFNVFINSVGNIGRSQ